MSWSFSIGRLLGSELRVHATFFLLLAWIGTAAWLTAGPTAAIVNVGFILALFACVVAHEFGHALAAKRYGIRTPDITLLPIGGMARLERIPEKPTHEIAVALAGPAVNIAIWASLVLILGVETSWDALGEIESTGKDFLARLAVVNLFLAIFNMIPAFPMDGGRVLRAGLAISLGRVRATQVAAQAGQVIAFIFGFLGLTGGNPLLILIAIFVFVAGMAESSDVELHHLAKGSLARDAMITTYEHLSPHEALHSAAAALVRTTQTEFPVLTQDGKLLGFLTKLGIAQRAQNDELSSPISSAMVANIPEVNLRDPLENALDSLQSADVPAVAVVDHAGVFLGYITRENIGEWMILHRNG
ncbi:MAG: site-2 protease family protein [Dinoroseobacter sp.]|nr:site-2 protease family protein [Dinoroseobacter sp.]